MCTIVLWRSVTPCPGLSPSRSPSLLRSPSAKMLLKFRQSVVVLVWSTTVLPNVRLMPSLRLMLSTEPVTLLLLPQKQKR